ncbi:2-C-methyl-D-erythritol 4-phosphate cytidylyltransferase [Alkaliphilus transvaalensis]|uniref:2-C-methyl-D-erythritol 4-phosphate cytidylyltransferase n=1 Tax=Alkaliphilus transvaalensis TaxID=114628 RepID=UPI00047EA004|nr:2-C-methyl-D-erythritol 4-phosphate cytidylyltransferase [Alkaliphilus transvaalensis]
MNKIGKNKAIIVAAGKGKRMGAEGNKQYILLRDKPVLAYTLEVFQDCPDIDEIIVVVAQGEVEYCKENIQQKYELNKIVSVIEGGKERFDSVYKGIVEAQDDCNVVVIHDGARPFISQEIIINTIKEAKVEGAVIVGVPVKDTIKLINQQSQVMETPQRENLWAIQTPQTFKYSLVRRAYEEINCDESITDDASLLEKAGHPVKVIMGSYENIKLTTPDDLLMAEAILKKREEKECLE